MMLACTIFITGSVIMCAVQAQAMLIVARIINGFGVGILTSQGYASHQFSSNVGFELSSNVNTVLYISQN